LVANLTTTEKIRLPLDDEGVLDGDQNNVIAIDTPPPSHGN
jgi:hypothetical protein